MHRITSASAFLVPLILLVATTAHSTGCGDSGQGLSNNDAGSNTSDASAIPDGGSDLDEDNDGFPASEDCDDNDDTIFPGTQRGCQSDCDNGIQICLADGTWLDCTARTDCDCSTPGEERPIACGNCGQATQECGLDLTWEFPGSCENEGVCHPTETEETSCLTCGSRTRGCSAQCEWEPWDTSQCFGVCQPGEEHIDNASCSDPWLFAHYQCDTTTCQFNTLVECTGDCFLAARTGWPGDFKNDICVPGGPFVMGSDPGEGYAANEQPEHIVNLSPYFIDKYEVTVARYRECVLASGCLVPEEGASNYFDSGSEDLPINNVVWDEARTFCQWDGRRLPTEAEWEKAARGPAPREVSMPWGDDPATCLHVPSTDCGQSGPEQVDSNPAGASFYQVVQLGGNVREWVNDFYDAAYYSMSPTLDPPGPASGLLYVARGPWYYDSLTFHGFANTIRAFYGDSYTAESLGFRCARSAVP